MRINIPKDVEYILDVINNNGFEVYIVGGCVRDSLLNRKPKDWDITTNAKPDQVKDMFEKSIDTGIKHGTITVMIDGIGYEVTTYRIDGEYSDNRRPDSVEFTSSLKEDLSRRDFTINAMAYNHKDGLIDYFDGMFDLVNKTIRCVGFADDRFKEDALRILRAIRFTTQLKFFELDLETSDFISINKNLLNNISKERIRDELCKILMSNDAKKGFNLMILLDVLDVILPELKACYGFTQNNPNHDKDVFGHIMAVLDNSLPILELRLAALFHDIGKPLCYSEDDAGIGHFYVHHMKSMDITEDVMKRLKFDNKTIDTVKILVKEHMSRYDHLRSSNIKRFINRVGVDNLDLLFKLQIADILGSSKRDDISNVINLQQECERILSEKQPLTVKDLNICGKDLIEIGYKQGKEIGSILNRLLEMVLENPELNNRENLIKFVQINIDK